MPRSGLGGDREGGEHSSAPDRGTPSKQASKQACAELVPARNKSNHPCIAFAPVLLVRKHRSISSSRPAATSTAGPGVLYIYHVTWVDG